MYDMVRTSVEYSFRQIEENAYATVTVRDSYTFSERKATEFKIAGSIVQS